MTQKRKHSLLSSVPTSILLLVAVAHAEPSVISPTIHLTTQSIVEDDTTATAVGGYLNIVTTPWHNLSAEVGFTTSQKIPLLNSDDAAGSSELFDENGDSFTNLNLANIRYQTKVLDAKIGRIILDTPYADRDDYRMVINTFEGFHATYTPLEELSIEGFGARAQSGYDAQYQNRFSPIAEGSDGFLAASLTYSPLEELSMSIWDYEADNIANFAYATLGYENELNDDVALEITLEAAHMQEYAQSEIDGTVLGVELEVEAYNLLLGFIYEYADVGENSYVSDGFGDGPYETSMDELSLGEVSEENIGSDIAAYKWRLGVDIRSLNIEYNFAYFDLRASAEHNLEHDVILFWDINEEWNFSTIYTYAQEDDETIKRLFTRLDFTFETP